jgi:hypothetical protein
VGVVVDPGVPPEVAGLLRANTPLLSRIRSGWVPPAAEPPARLKSPAGVVLLAASMAPAAFALLGAFVFVVLVRIASMNEVPEDDRPHERAVYEQARLYDGRYLLAEDFDPEAAAVLARAQGAIGTVLRSHVNAEGLLDDARNAVMLPAQEWEIARLLAKLSGLRAKHRRTVSEGVTPEVAAVAEPLARALDSSENAVVARVEALERYAANVVEAERAYRAHHQIAELRGRLHQYEELVAETGADTFSVPELTRLADDAGQLEQALRRSVNSAREAFGHLEP